MGKIIVNFDGSCGPKNPGGQIGYACIIKDSDENFIFRDSQKEEASPENTNNVAEYKALILALSWLLCNGYMNKCIEVIGDSKLVINQMSGEWRAKSGSYYDQYLEAQRLAANFTNIRFLWVPRSKNAEVDAISR